MNNHYQIIDSSDLGIPSVEVYGHEFDYLDLFELVGRQQYMTTFRLKEGSEARERFGESVVGVIYYEFETLQKLVGHQTEEIDLGKIKIDSPAFNECMTDLGDLKYGGIKVADVESIFFLPYKKKNDVYDTGEKVVPNIIEIEADFSGVDSDILRQNYLVTKNNQKVELIHYEKELLVGLTLGLNEGHIDSRILNHLGFNKDSIANNLNIWFHLYGVKERRGTLSDEEREKYSNIQEIRYMEAVTKLFKEIRKSGLNADEVSEKGDFLKKIIESVTSFSPGILLHGNRQVYWDIDSYLHIVMRHIKDYQVGNFREKTPFPYKAHDLEMLIEQVIGRVKSEYQAHAARRPMSNFSRHGSMAVRFNEDYYQFRIDPSGRLTQFHILGKF